MLKAPIARPINYIKHGGAWAAITSAGEAFANSNQPFLDAFIAYLLAKILPPLTPVDIATTFVLGAISAGFAWYSSDF
jgi:hypothetical protein